MTFCNSRSYCLRLNVPFLSQVAHHAITFINYLHKYWHACGCRSRQINIHWWRFIVALAIESFDYQFQAIFRGGYEYDITNTIVRSAQIKGHYCSGTINVRESGASDVRKDSRCTTICTYIDGAFIDSIMNGPLSESPSTVDAIVRPCLRGRLAF